MALDAKSLKALGFTMVDGKLVPIESKQPKLPKNKILNEKVVKQNSNVKQTLVQRPIVKSNNSDVYNPKINQKNPFFSFLTHEDVEHIKVVNFLKSNYPDVVWFHPASEGKRSPFERYKFSLMGNLKGLPDFVICHPKFRNFNEGGIIVRKIIYFALFIELKANEHKRIVQKGKQAGKVVKAKGKASDEQLEVIDKLNKFGYRACLAMGAQEAINIINDYFKG